MADERIPQPESVARYLAWVDTQRKLAPLTLKAYRSELAMLVRLVAAETTAAPDVALENLRDVDVRRHAARLHARGLAPRSIARALSAWRGYFDWRMRHEDGIRNPVADVKAPKLGRRLPKALSETMTMQLLDHPATVPDEIIEIRDAAIRELFYSSGLRLAELVMLDVGPSKHAAGWIALAAGEVEVTGKGNKRRTVPVGGVAARAIERWLAVRGRFARQDAGHDVRALFLSRRGERLSGRSIQLRLKAAARVAGVPANVHPHVLRHSFASHMLQATGDLRAVQELLGHASIAATQVYTSLDFQRLAQVYDAAHPRARRKQTA